MTGEEAYIEQLEREGKRLRDETRGYRDALRSIARFYVAPYDVSGAANDLRRLKEIADSALVEAERAVVKGNSAQ